MLVVGYGVTVFLSAFLLFQVQPLISKAILPWFGGTPSVWTMCMLMFQLMLFAGYLYAHITTMRLSPRVQTLVHLAVLVAAAVSLPILPGAEWKPSAGESPSVKIVMILLFSIGLPFFTLSATGPLVQGWFHRSHAGRSPYRLYSLSNAGSLLALVLYPFVVEPSLPLGLQSSVWSWMFVVFALLCATCSIKVMLSTSGRPDALRPASETAAEADRSPPGRREMALWFALGMVPSVMLLATTNQVCLDVASVPFLWIFPLSLYLLSFILCFDSTRWYSRTVFSIAFGLLTIVMTGTLIAAHAASILVQVVALFSGLFVCAMFCHGELARRKPHPDHLTSFYLVLAAAGAAGGLFAGVVAPLLFDSFIEVHLSILATCALILIVFYEDRHWAFGGGRPRWAWGVLLIFAAAATIAMGYSAFRNRGNAIYAARNFYGVLRVTERSYDDPEDTLVRLTHGRITHGSQFQSEAKRRQPTEYYIKKSGAGLALEHHHCDRPRHIGVVGLGAGTLAAYGKTGDTIRFYEINEKVVWLARKYFTFLEDCPAECHIAMGDARLSMENELQAEQPQPQRFDVLLVDAFSSDAIPTHLLTREAVEIYLAHMKPDGILAVHISNRHFDLEPVLAALSAEHGLASCEVCAASELDGESYSDWVLLCREQEVFRNEVFRDFPSLDGGRQVLWTDVHCNILTVLKVFRFSEFFGE